MSSVSDNEGNGQTAYDDEEHRKARVIQDSYLDVGVYIPIYRICDCSKCKTLRETKSEDNVGHE